MMATNSPKHYWVRCADGALPVAQNRLELLCEMMPILQNLLFGHPQMKPKTLQEHGDGAPILEIPFDLGVSAGSFALLLDCALGPEPFPERKEEFSTLANRLKEVITKLGGCDSLLQRLHEHSAKNNPMLPQEDTYERFIWQILKENPYSGTSIMTSRHAVELEGHGYSFTTSYLDPEEQGTNTMRAYIYRKEK